VLVFGLLVLAATPDSRLLLIGVAELLGAADVYLIGPPEQFASGPAVVPLASLFLADELSNCAAVALPVALALSGRGLSRGRCRRRPHLRTRRPHQSTPQRKLAGAGLVGLDLPDLRSTPRVRVLGITYFVFIDRFTAIARYLFSLTLIRPSPSVAPPCLPATTSRPASPPSLHSLLISPRQRRPRPQIPPRCAGLSGPSSSASYVGDYEC
jgi:hypothetical protein